MTGRNWCTNTPVVSLLGGRNTGSQIFLLGSSLLFHSDNIPFTGRPYYLNCCLYSPTRFSWDRLANKLLLSGSASEVSYTKTQGLLILYPYDAFPFLHWVCSNQERDKCLGSDIVLIMKKIGCLIYISVFLPG